MGALVQRASFLPTLFIVCRFIFLLPKKAFFCLHFCNRAHIGDDGLGGDGL